MNDGANIDAELGTYLGGNYSLTNYDVKVEMGETDITSTAYSATTGKLTIEHVNDDVLITLTTKSGT